MTTTVPLPGSISAVSPLSPAEINDRLLALLSQRVLTRAAGEHLPALSRLPGSPQQHLWLGQLASELVVVAESTAWATQLRLLTKTLHVRIKEHAGEGVATKIVVRGPAQPDWRKGPRRVQGRGPRDTYG